MDMRPRRICGISTLLYDLSKVIYGITFNSAMQHNDDQHVFYFIKIYHITAYTIWTVFDRHWKNKNYMSINTLKPVQKAT